MSVIFHPLKVKKVKKETPDCVSVSFDVPAELSEQFKFTQGQYLTFRQMNGEQELRRSYSICASPYEGELKVAVKKVPEGLFSSFMNENLKEGDVLEVMPPMGKFYTELSPENKKNVCCFCSRKRNYTDYFDYKICFEKRTAKSVCSDLRKQK